MTAERRTAASLMTPGSGHLRSRASVLAVLACASFGGCEQTDAVFPDADHADGWRLVGAYDASALRSTDLLLAPDDRPAPYEYKWLSPAAMNKACGMGKAPDGLGIFEAEAVANRMMPALVLVVERTGDVPALDTQRVRVAIGDGEPQFFLKPMVEPRYLQVAIDGGNVAPRFRQQVKTQLQTYLCMEHKTGRAWQGGTLDQVRQALLLNPPDEILQDDPDPSDEKVESVRLSDRKFFGGQSEPVAALLGPPSVCLGRAEDVANVAGKGGQGNSSLSLVPSDVWGASLVPCREGTAPGRMYVGPLSMSLSVSDEPLKPKGPREGLAPKVKEAADARPEEEASDADTLAKLDTHRRTWSQMRISMRATGDTPTDQHVSVQFSGREMSSGAGGKDHSAEILPDQPMFVNVEGGEVGLIDLVSGMPYRFPTTGPELDPERYSVLIVPNWQVVEGVRRLRAGSLDRPRNTGGDGVQDGVGWILDHPDSLFVMVPRNAEIDPWQTPLGGDDWLNIAGVMSGGFAGLRDWGYTVGILAGRTPIALPGPVVPTWFQASTAQRAPQHSLVLGSSAVLIALLLAGLVRIRDMWTRVPEERVAFWPGPPVEEKKGDDMAELSKAGGGEEK